MKLYGSKTSPFVAKCRIIINECGLKERIEIEDVSLSPGTINIDFAKKNPLRQIPTLITEDGVALYDSFVICDYLIRMAGNKTLLPDNGPDRTRVLHIHALCSGITERAVQTRYEMAVRPEEYRWQTGIDDNMDRIKRGLSHLNDAVINAIDGPFDISEAAFVTMLRYLDFRYSDLSWREDYPNLVSPFESLNEMSCVQMAYE